jgi:hypothetical protein
MAELKYNLNMKGKSKMTKKSTMIRKNIKHMSKDEERYLKEILTSVNKIIISKHALEKELIGLNEIKSIIKNKNFKIIDYNYRMEDKEERIMFRSKKTYQIINTRNNKIAECYIKIVFSIKKNTIITQWATRVKDEEEIQNKISTRYYENFDIINKRIKL